MCRLWNFELRNAVESHTSEGGSTKKSSDEHRKSKRETAAGGWFRPTSGEFSQKNLRTAAY
jgi:hypothetical protein